MADKTLNPCPPFSPFEDNVNIDPPSPYCPCDEEPSQKDVGLFDDPIYKKIGIGQSQLCDEFQTGQIRNELDKAPSRNTIYRYSKAIRGCDEAVTDLFRDIVVIDEQGVAHPVSIIWATQERAVTALIQPNVRKDDTNVVDRISLPAMAIHSSDFSPNYERYTYHQALNYFRDKEGLPGLTFREKKDKDTIFGLARGIPIDIGYQLVLWTFYMEDMNQILEQILLKFSRLAYIRIQGVPWETGVRLDSIANNINMEPGDTTQRVIKFQIGMTAETYIPQPIARKKSVLKEKIEFTNSVDPDEIVEILGRLNIE